MAIVVSLETLEDVEAKIKGGRRRKRGPRSVADPMPVCSHCRKFGNGTFTDDGTLGLIHWRCRDLAYWDQFRHGSPRPPTHFPPPFWRPARWRHP